MRWRWKQGNTNYIDGYDLEENAGYLNQDDSKPLKYVYLLGFTISLKVKPIRFDGITCREWKTLSQDIWAELYLMHKRISKFKRNLETFQSGLILQKNSFYHNLLLLEDFCDEMLTISSSTHPVFKEVCFWKLFSLYWAKACSVMDTYAIITYKKKYIFGLHPHFWHKAPKTLENS